MSSLFPDPYYHHGLNKSASEIKSLRCGRQTGLISPFYCTSLLHCCSFATTVMLLILSATRGSRVRLPWFQCNQFRVLRVAPVQVFAVTFMVVHEGWHLCDGGRRVGRGAHWAVVLPSLTPLRFILHPLSLKSCLHLEDTQTHRLRRCLTIMEHCFCRHCYGI